MISWSEKQQAALQGGRAFWLKNCAYLPLFLAGCIGHRFSDCHSSPRESKEGSQCCSFKARNILPTYHHLSSSSTQLYHMAGEEGEKEDRGSAQESLLPLQTQCGASP